jgi:hypothetical protein
MYWLKKNFKTSAEKVVTTSGSSVWVGKKYSSRQHKVATVTPLQDYSRLQTAKQEFFTVGGSGVGIQRTF